jgi:hypothetical protein
MVDDGLDLGDKEWSTVLGVPRDVEVDLGVIVTTHDAVSRALERLKPNREKPRERGSGE